MRQGIDRLLRALVPYAGLLTVASGPCGGAPECDGPNLKVATLTAQESGDVAIDADLDGRIAAPVRDDGEPLERLHGGWRCEARVVGRSERASADAPAKPLETAATITCAFDGSTGVTTRVWTFNMPLVDLRATSFARETHVAMTVRDETPSLPGACEGRVDALLGAELVGARGGEAPPPDWVTSDFVRDLDLRVTVDGSTTPTTPECARRLKGTFTLSVHVDRAFVQENDVSTCL